MAMQQRYIYLDGIYEKEVLGIFTIIRGFANLKDLAKISVPYEMAESDDGSQVVGHQRQINEKHAAEIKQYLEKSDARFFPEVILSVRTDYEPVYYGEGETEQVGIISNNVEGIQIYRRYTSRTVRVHQIKIDSRKLQEIKERKLIRRIDGNHRLHLAEQLQEDEHVPNKYLAPFCMIIQKPPDDTADDYAESKIFHIINSKALPLESEHALSLLLGQRDEHSMTPQQEFEYDPALYLTRLLSDKISHLPNHLKERLGDCPLTVLNETANVLLKANETIEQDISSIQAFANGLFGAITEFLSRLWGLHPQLCKAHYFIELAACTWAKFDDPDNTRRINDAVEYLQDLGDWLGEEGFISIKPKDSFAQQLLKVYESIRNKIPKRVFLSRWYPNQERNGEAFRKANLRLEQIKETLNKVKEEHNIELELIDLGTEEGGTFSIHRAIYDSIDSSDIIIIDLTGHRPNVCVEAGYALKHYNIERMIFLFQSSEDDPRVAFDLNTYKYEPVSEAAEIPGKVKPHIEAILRNSGVNI